MVSTQRTNPTAVAIVCVRNEAVHIRPCVRDFIRQGIEIILIDNDSTDGSTEIAREFLGKGLLSIERLPWRGSFSLSDQLSFKNQIAGALSHDWIIHADADEWLQAPLEYDNLLDGIRATDEAGFNCINFREFVFVPLPGEDFEAEDYRSRMRDYYFLSPYRRQLMRAWKRSSGMDNTQEGGHVLHGSEVRLLPRDFILRHYIVLSEAHAARKYLGRKFAAEDLAKNWHNCRVKINDGNIKVKPGPPLMRLEHPDSLAFDTSHPTSLQFWEWP